MKTSESLIPDFYKVLHAIFLKLLVAENAEFFRNSQKFSINAVFMVKNMKSFILKRRQILMKLFHFNHSRIMCY